MVIKFTLNTKSVSLDTDPETPLLWVIRDELKLNGTKFGCGIGLCGACTVHVNGSAVRSCSLPVSEVSGQNVTTIEGLGKDKPHPLQESWLNNNVPQCGYCQAGQIMAAATLLKENPHATDEEIQSGMTNICRCGTYAKINKAVADARDKINNQ